MLMVDGTLVDLARFCANLSVPFFILAALKEMLMTKNLQAIVLAAGKSTGFKTGKTKLVEKLCGQEMILYTTRLLEAMQLKTHVVVGYQKEIIEEIIKKQHTTYFTFIEQEEQHGTAHAILCSNTIWQEDNILILFGDMPLVTQDIIDIMLKKHTDTNAAITLVTSHVTNPMDTEYARVIKKDGGIKIVYPSELTDDLSEHCCIDAGMYIFKRSFLEQHLDTIQKNENSQEFHMSDLINVASEYKETIATIAAPFDIVRGINTLQELWAAEQIKRSELIRYWMDKGVRFSVAQNVHIDLNVSIGAGSFIGCGAHLIGNTIIGENSSVMEFSSVEHSVLGDNVLIEPHCIVRDSVIKSGAVVGPFAHVRGNTELHENTHVGNFVEVKNSVLQKNTKAKHLAYLGDAQIENNVNIGAGTITCNYNGKEKHITTIKENTFVGSNSSLVAPVTIERNSYIAAGSTITKDVPEQSLAIARARQENKENYTPKHARDVTEKDSSQTSIDKKDAVFIAAKKAHTTINMHNN